MQSSSVQELEEEKKNDKQEEKDKETMRLMVHLVWSRNIVVETELGVRC